MDNIIDTIKSQRNISESTLKTYRRHLAKIMKMSDENNINGLQNSSKIIPLLENSGASPSSIRAYLASLVVCMDAHKMDANEYRNVMNKYIQLEKQKYNEHQKTETEKANWITTNEIAKLIKGFERKIKTENFMKKEKLTKQEKLFLQKYVVAMLYCGDPVNHLPVRLDYSPMLVINEKDYLAKKENNELPTGMNFLVVKSRNKKQFAFHNYKTIKTHGIKLVPLSPKINSAVNKLLKFNNTEFLFENNLNKPLSSNALGKLLSSAFETTGKNISVNLLRHIYITEKYPVEKTKEQENDAEKMLHSVATQKIYAKMDE